MARQACACDCVPPPPQARPSATSFDRTFVRRRAEADAFYQAVSPAHLDDDGRRIFRQALAGMLWSKQHYHYDVARWLEQHGASPFSGEQRRTVRNAEWFHMANDDVISMPDKWEYPWYATWDLGFHCLALVLVDPEFAKQQLELMLLDDYFHPNGQLPAYEWSFGDVNPPVHSWAAYFVYEIDKARNGGVGDVKFLGHVFQKLLANFTWWSNRKDPSGRNVFQGGFLGLDNIGVFDRSAPLPTGGHMDQADGTGWMALYAQTMLQIAVELAAHDPVYEPLAVKFFEHFVWIGSALGRMGDRQDDLWDEEDGFFYDVLRLPDGSAQRLKVRSIVGLLPLCAATVFEPAETARIPNAIERGHAFLARFPHLVKHITLPTKPAANGRRLLAVLDEARLRRVLTPGARRGGIPQSLRNSIAVALPPRSSLPFPGRRAGLLGALPPAESESGSFGGNSNWRGPVWMPINQLIVRALLNLHRYYGEELQGRMPDRFRPAAHAARDRRRDCPPNLRHLPARARRKAPALWRHREVPDQPALARPDPVLRVFPRRQRRRHRRQPPDWLDRRHIAAVDADRLGSCHGAGLRRRPQPIPCRVRTCAPSGVSGAARRGGSGHSSSDVSLAALGRTRRADGGCCRSGSLR